MKFSFAILFVLVALTFSCKNKDASPSVSASLDALPADTGGKHTPLVLGADSSPFGYYVYTPSAYTKTGPKFPLLIFLHGSGEIGNSKTSAATLDKVMANGPPRLIKDKKWSPKYPMVVVSPQCHESWWDYTKVKAFIEFVATNYQVDTTRIYLTGLSMGGYGTYDQMISFGKKGRIAAAVPISGATNVNDKNAKAAAEIPFWAFHGEDDGTVDVNYDKNLHASIHSLVPNATAKLTLYPGVGHDCWTETYNGSGMGKEDKAFDAFNMDAYTWLFQFQKK